MHITYIYSDIIQNKGYAPRLALGRRGVNKVSRWLLWGSLLYENLLLVLLLARGHKLYQLVIYMHENDDATLNNMATTTLKISVDLNGLNNCLNGH